MYLSQNKNENNYLRMEEKVKEQLNKYLIDDLVNIVIKYIPFIDPNMVARINSYYQNKRSYVKMNYDIDTKRYNTDNRSPFGSGISFPDILYLISYKNGTSHYSLHEDKYYTVELKDGRFANINIFTEIDYLDDWHYHINVHFSNKQPDQFLK